MFIQPLSSTRVSKLLLLCVTMHVVAVVARPASAGSAQPVRPAATGTSTTQKTSAEATDVDNKNEDECGSEGADLGENDWSSHPSELCASPSIELLFGRGRRYDALPKMDHFACKSDGLCIRPVGDKSIRIGLRSGESEIVVEAVFAGDGTVGLDSPSQWCLRLSDRGLGAIASFDNGQCPSAWATENKHPLFTPTASILADARGRVDVVGRRRLMVAKMTNLLADSSVPLGKEHAARQAFFFLKHYGVTSPLRSIHDDKVMTLGLETPPGATIEFTGETFRQKQ